LDEGIDKSEYIIEAMPIAVRMWSASEYVGKGRLTISLYFIQPILLRLNYGSGYFLNSSFTKLNKTTPTYSKRFP